MGVITIRLTWLRCNWGCQVRYLVHHQQGSHRALVRDRRVQVQWILWEVSADPLSTTRAALSSFMLWESYGSYSALANVCYPAEYSAKILRCAIRNSLLDGSKCPMQAAKPSMVFKHQGPGLRGECIEPLQSTPRMIIGTGMTCMSPQS